MKLIFISCVLFSIFVSGFGLKCPICNGSSCQTSDAPLHECIFRPVFKDLRYMTFEADPEYGCLHIVYSQDEYDKEERQCVVINNKKDVCESLKKVFNVKFCQIERDGYDLSKTADNKVPNNEIPINETPTYATTTEAIPTDEIPTCNTTIYEIVTVPPTY